MGQQQTPEGLAYAKSIGLASWDYDGHRIVRPGIGYNLTLRLGRKGQAILRTNSSDIAIVKSGDMLKMYIFNKHVKRALGLSSKNPVNVTISESKTGLLGIHVNGRFLPLNALRGHVSFSVVSLSYYVERARTIETI